MKKIVYIRGKWKGSYQEMKAVYLYGKETMIRYGLEPQYIGVIAEEGWKGEKILTIKRKEKQLLQDVEEKKNILAIELYTKEIIEKQIRGTKSYFIIDKEKGTVAFWSNTNIEKINFEEILKEMKQYVEAGIEEICDWESDSGPLRYILEGEKTINTDDIFSDKVTVIYKKVTPLDIPIEV